MGVVKLSKSEIRDYQKYSSMLAGNPAFFPLTDDFELLESTILSTTASSVGFSSLNTYTGYRHLQVRFSCRNDVTTSGAIALRMNNDSGSNYSYRFIYGTGTSVTSFGSGGQTLLRAGLTIPSDGRASNFAPSIIDILDYASTNKNTTIRVLYGLQDGTGASNEIAIASGAWYNTAAVTSLTFTPPAGNFVAGTRFSIYGVK